ncbi:MAG: hypothetical protein NXI09_13725 [Bacteroidetes bacterium]|nr:hypothetical protein [Bacteroidota bacterium]
MGLSKRKSRKITVDGHVYRWSPSQDSGYMVLVVQGYSGKGKKLEVVISNDENITIEFGNYSIEIGDSNKLIMSPKLVETIIRDSMNIGWNPALNGPPLELSLIDGNLDIRRGL